MTRSDFTLCSWNSPAPSAGNAGFYLSRSVSGLPNSPLDPETPLYTEFGDWCRNVCTLYKTHIHNTSDLIQHISDTWASISQNDEAVGQWRKQLYACVKAKGHHFEHLLNYIWHFSEPTYYTTGSFQSHQQSTKEDTLFCVLSISAKKQIKISTSERRRKVEYTYHFWKCADTVYQKLSKLVHACRNYTFFSDTV